VQRQRLADARVFERKMAGQREAAALGRTTVTITHEMRNPLNAIGIGLQRLEIEATGLSLEHRGLVTGMREAVSRSNGIISRLRQYVHSFELVYEKISLCDLLGSLVNLYAAQCKEQGIVVQLKREENCIVQGDKNLMGQIFENLLKNSIEAQPGGGFIDINLTRGEQECSVLLSNGGVLPDSGKQSLLLEPFFTTKAKGTGLGLVISKKIVEAHGGKLELQIGREEQVFRVVVTLPMRPISMKPLQT
jgi:two-component system, NtrC family, sensor histidine kinase HydH